MFRTLFTTASVLLCAAPLLAGPLNPPGGPVLPTHKTLTEVEPRTAISLAATPGDADSVYRITAPGSYYLAGNVQGVSGKHGIEIDIPDGTSITIDLGGFEVVGVPGSLSGIVSPAGRVVATTIRSGTLRNWGQAGIDLAPAAEGCIATDLRAQANGGIGLNLGRRSVVSRCVAIRNGAGGLVCGDGGRITDCIADGNTGNGIAVGDGCEVTGCTVMQNTLSGIVTSVGCGVSRCTVRANGQNGIVAGTHAFITGNHCSINGSAGIFSTAIFLTVDGNFVVGNARGIHYVGNVSAMTVRNYARANTVANYTLGSIGTVGMLVSVGGAIPAATGPWSNFDNPP